MSWPFGSAQGLGAVHKEGFVEYNVPFSVFALVTTGGGPRDSAPGAVCYNNVMNFYYNIRLMEDALKEKKTRISRMYLKRLEILKNQVLKDIKKIKKNPKAALLVKTPSCVYPIGANRYNHIELGRDGKRVKQTRRVVAVRKRRVEGHEERLRYHERFHARMRQLEDRMGFDTLMTDRALLETLRSVGGSEAAANVIQYEYNHGRGPEEVLARAEEIVQSCKSEPTLEPYMFISNGMIAPTKCGDAIFDWGNYLLGSQNARRDDMNVDGIVMLAEVIKQAYNNDTLEFVKDSMMAVGKRRALMEKTEPAWLRNFPRMAGLKRRRKKR